MLSKKKKQSVIKSNKIHDTDSGSTQVQIAILSEEIRELAAHLKKHKHDYSARRGLMRKIGQRKRFLVYLQREDEKEYDTLVKKLGIKHRPMLHHDDDLPGPGMIKKNKNTKTEENK